MTTPLTQRLQIKPGKRWLFFNAPENYLPLLEPLPEGVTVVFDVEGQFEGVQLFVKNSDELSSSLHYILPLLGPDTIFWICYPKKTSGMNSDLSMTGNKIESALHGLTCVTSVSVNDTWTALRFKPVEKTNAADTRNAMIRQNEYAEFIDVDAKTVTLPGSIKQLLEQTPPALAFYQQLSYSNKKEYVLWIMTAKQDKTREERLAKMMEKLLAGKKNPSEK